MVMMMVQVAAAAEEIASIAMELEASSGSRGRSAFQWGASFCALLLLILNQIARRSSFQASLLVLFLVTSLPSVIFKILRGQFGCWVSILAIAINYCFHPIFPVSRFALFVIAPDWLANELRETIAGGVFCLVIGVLLVTQEILVWRHGHEPGEPNRCTCNLLCSAYWLSMAILFFFTILYLCLGPW